MSGTSMPPRSRPWPPSGVCQSFVCHPSCVCHPSLVVNICRQQASSMLGWLLPTLLFTLARTARAGVYCNQVAHAQGNSLFEGTRSPSRWLATGLLAMSQEEKIFDAGICDLISDATLTNDLSLQVQLQRVLLGSRSRLWPAPGLTSGTIWVPLTT